MELKLLWSQVQSSPGLIQGGWVGSGALWNTTSQRCLLPTLMPQGWPFVFPDQLVFGCGLPWVGLTGQEKQPPSAEDNA